MNRWLILLLLVLGLSCWCCHSESDPRPPFKAFEFFYGGTWSVAFSMKWTQTDTVFMQQYFAGEHQDTGDSSIKLHTVYYGVWGSRQRHQFNDLIRSISFGSYDSSYIQPDVQDATTMEFYLTTDAGTKAITIYDDRTPQALAQLATQLSAIKKNMHWTRLDTMIPFLHHDISALPLDRIKFIPPAR